VASSRAACRGTGVADVLLCRPRSHEFQRPSTNRTARCSSVVAAISSPVTASTCWLAAERPAARLPASAATP
jgi:hypothetical protein